MATLTEPTVADIAGCDIAERFVDSLTDVIDRLQSRSCGYLDEKLLVELRDTIEDQAWRAVQAYQPCCWLEGYLDGPAVAGTVGVRRTGEQVMLTRGPLARCGARRVSLSLRLTRVAGIVLWIAVISTFASVVALNIAGRGAAWA